MGVQIGITKHSKVYRVAPHLHIRTRNETVIVTEILIVLKDRVRIDLYDDEGRHIHSLELREGMEVATNCSHSVELLEDSIPIEIKEDSYPGAEEDKIWIWTQS